MLDDASLGFVSSRRGIPGVGDLRGFLPQGLEAKTGGAGASKNDGASLFFFWDLAFPFVMLYFSDKQELATKPTSGWNLHSRFR